MSKAILTIDSTEPITLFEALRQQRAAEIAANRTAKKVIASMTRVVRARMGVRAKDVRKRIVLERAHINPVRVAIQASSIPVPLGSFRAAQLKRAGVKVHLPRGTKTFKGAFKARMKSGHLGVFRRKKETYSREGLPWGSPELPIREMYGPSIADIFDDEWEQHGLAVFREHFDDELFRALRYYRGAGR